MNTASVAKFAEAVQTLGWSQENIAPHHSQSFEMGETAVRRLREGIAVLLSQSGLNDSWWSEAMNCYCFLHNAVYQQNCGNTVYFKRFGASFSGPLIAMGTAVFYKLSSINGHSSKGFPRSTIRAGVFMGYSQRDGGDWDSNLLIMD